MQEPMQYSGEEGVTMSARAILRFLYTELASLAFEIGGEYESNEKGGDPEINAKVDESKNEVNMVGLLEFASNMNQEAVRRWVRDLSVAV